MQDVQKRLAEEALYEQVAAEIAAGFRREGLWAKAISESGGSVEHARALYIRHRVQSLLDEAESERFARLEHQQRTDAEARRKKQANSSLPIWVVCIVVVVIFVAIGQVIQK